MVFKKMLSAFGVGGPSVDTMLETPHVRPGDVLRGQVHLTGGKTPAEVECISVGLVTGVEVESGDTEYDSLVEFHTQRVAGAFTLATGEQRSVPFELPVPFEPR
jgi:sporulation-control protein